MTKKENTLPNKQAEELHAVCNFREQVAPAVYAGVKEQEGWPPNKMVSPAQFERAVARFMSS